MNQNRISSIVMVMVTSGTHVYDLSVTHAYWQDTTRMKMVEKDCILECPEGISLMFHMGMDGSMAK
jgi:hypothetical protein